MDSREGQAATDPPAAALFHLEHVTNVFYVDRWLTVTQDGRADWRELSRDIAGPLRAAPAASEATGIAESASPT